MKSAPVIAAALLILMVGCRGSAQEAESFQKVLQSRSPSIVTLRLVSKMDFNAGGQSQSHEMRTEIQGVVVDKEGLIMVSSFSMNPYSMGLTGETMAIKMVPTSIKVVFGGDEKEYNAFVAATDTKLNLSFIQIEDTAGKNLVPVAFTAGTTPAIGERLIAVSRMARGYDYSVFYQTGRINGEIDRPRHAWMVEGGISGFGLPVFNMNNDLVGVLTTIPSTIKEDAQNPDTMGIQMALRMLSGGGGLMQPFLIPASMVDGVIGQAKVRAHELAAKRKAGGGAEAPKSEAPKKPAKAPAGKK
ncbi:MAG TPA: hypothetical protein VKT77_17950 [Chthonomonadaceae bacterium]|nr:hypothetical protein [Chthonomonadaceae bacterium]